MKRKITHPTEAEDRKITAAAKADPDNPPLDDNFFRRARRGRPELPADERKKRVNLMLDPDVVALLKAQGNMSEAANRLLREALEG